MGALAVILPCLILGWPVGAWFGGNYAVNMRFNGVRGYQARDALRYLCFPVARRFLLCEKVSRSLGVITDFYIQENEA
jgi:hypothetical protein